MLRSLAFTTQGRLHSKDIEIFLMPTLLADTNLFLWVDLEKPTAEETKSVLEDVFHFHPLSVEDALSAIHHPKIESYDNYLYLILHGIDANASRSELATRDVDFFLDLPTEAACRAVQPALEADGFKTDFRPFEGELNEGYSLHATKSLRVSVTEIHEQSQRFTALAKTHGGRYDGWAVAGLGKPEGRR